MKKLMIDTDLCIGCGLCTNICPCYHLSVEDKKSMEGDGLCIQCGQCQNICPKQAIKVERLKDQQTMELKDLNHKIDPENLRDFYLSRRSCRFFTDEDITKEEFENLISYATTNDASYFNIQTNEYVVLEDKFSDFKAHLLHCLEDELDKSEYIDHKGEKVDRNDFVRYFNMYMKGEFPHDPFFHEGRQAIAVFAKHPVDAALGMAHIESMAYAMGLGGFWLGYAITASEKKPEETMKFFPSVDQDKRMYALFVLGHPRIKYNRTSVKPPVKITYM